MDKNHRDRIAFIRICSGKFEKGLTQLSEEGAIQIYRQPNWGMEELIVGVVGVLQFEVLEYRLKQEYGVDIIMQGLPYSHVRWIENDMSKYGKLSMPMDTLLVEDKNRNSVVLFANEWSVRTLVERNEGLVVRETSL